MSRCDYEGAFYRVFCVSLLVIAFTFTVILTNVFVDIDNLLSKKDRESTENVQSTDLVTDGFQTTTEIPEYYIGNERNDKIDDENYRTKRSLDSEKFFLHINSPKTKSYLTNRLAALLEALDEDEVENTTPKQDNANIYIKTVKQRNNIEINELRPETIDSRGQKGKDEDLLHLSMHNILLQGIIGRMDMNEVYDKLQALVNAFKYKEKEKETKNANRREKYYTETTTQGTITLNEEQNLIQQLLKYKMGEQVTRDNHFEIEDATRTDKKRSKGPKYLIKTLIDIKKDENANSKENFQGVIKLIYNGKPIKIRGDDHVESTTWKTTTPTTKKQYLEIKPKTQMIESATNTINKDVKEFADVLKDNYKNRHVTDSYLKTILLEYLKKLSNSNDSSIIEKNNIRIKRNLEWSQEKQTQITQTKDDDELFVEIETHFDKKGLKGEKKRRLVSSLIKKIQNAIGSENKQQDKDSSELQITKRVQNPLDHDTAPVFTKTMAPPASNLYRELNPISKSVPAPEPLPHMSDQNGDDWKIQYNGPKFLSKSKSINSAELGQLHVEYNQEMKEPVIPKRIQIPLTTDTSDENINSVDVGKLQLLIKDIEGTGFSIGYNQYVDQEPDPESIKLFHGIEGIVNNYHEKYDKPNQNGNFENEYEIYGQELKKREVENSETPPRTKRYVINRHNVRRSVNEINNYHTNEYVYNDNYRFFDAYKEVYDSREINTKQEGNGLQEIKLNKRGKPSEINAYRKKRSLNLRRIVNLKKKIRINKYLNTNTVPRQRRDFKIRKRNKRQINKKSFRDKHESTRENNNMFIVSGGDINNNNPIIQHRQSPEIFFGIVQKIKRSNGNPILQNKPFFQPSHQPRSLPTTTDISPRLYEHLNAFDENLSKNNMIEEKKERNKRQIHSIRIIAKDSVHKESNEKTFAEYDEDIYADRSTITQVDEPIITIADKDDQVGIANDRADHEQVIYRNPFAVQNNEHTLGNNPLLFGHDSHAFSLDPLTRQMKNNPLMSKYPHIFVEDRTSGEHPDFKHIHRTVCSRSDNKEPDLTPKIEDSYRASSLQDLVNAVVPSQRNNYKVTVKLIPHDNYNDSKPSFKEIHTTINKTYNKNGVLYSSLVNVSEISEIVELYNKTKNTTHSCDKHLKTTLQSTNANTVKQKKRPKGTVSDSFVTEKAFEEYNKERNKLLRSIKKEPREAIQESAAQTTLMDIILPSNPLKVFHLTVADVGKLICDSMTTTQTTTTASIRTTTEKLEPKTTMSTTVRSTEVPTTTNKPEKPTTHADPQTIDSLKTKLLRAIAQNEQLTNQILEKIDQNTGVLQTFLTKISSEIAKIPDIASQAIMDKNRNYYHSISSNSYSKNGSHTPSFVYSIQQPTPPQNMNSALIPQTIIKAAPLAKRLRAKDRMAALQENINVNNSDESRERTKYFLDYDLNKTGPGIEGNRPQKLAIKNELVSDKTNKTSIRNLGENNNHTTSSNLSTATNAKNLTNEQAKNNISEITPIKLEREEYIMLLTIYNTILQGILRYKDIDEVYKRFISLTLHLREQHINERKHADELILVIQLQNNIIAHMQEIVQNFTKSMYTSTIIHKDRRQITKAPNLGLATNFKYHILMKPNTMKPVEIDNTRNENYEPIPTVRIDSHSTAITMKDDFRNLATIILKKAKKINISDYLKIKKTRNIKKHKINHTMKPNTMKPVEIHNTRNENYEPIPLIRIYSHATLKIINDDFRSLAAIILKTRKKMIVPDYLKIKVTKNIKTHKINHTISPIKRIIKRLNLSDHHKKVETLGNNNDDEEIYKEMYSKIIKNKIKIKATSFIATLQKIISQKYRTSKPKPRVKRAVRPKDPEKVKFTEMLLTIWNAFVYAAKRELRNLGPILKMYPPKKWVVNFWKNKRTLGETDPKTFDVLTTCGRLMIEQVYGIQTNYDSLVPKYYFDMTAAVKRGPD